MVQLELVGWEEIFQQIRVWCTFNPFTVYPFSSSTFFQQKASFLPPPPHPKAYDSMIQYMPISHKTHLYLNNVNLIQHVFAITHEVSLFGLITPSCNES